MSISQFSIRIRWRTFTTDWGELKQPALAGPLLSGSRLAISGRPFALYQFGRASIDSVPMKSPERFTASDNDSNESILFIVW
jgi:hypothetical protein